MTETPKFKTKKDGTKIFDPDTRLSEKVGKEVSNLITEKNIQAANNAIEKTSLDFPDAMLPDLKDLNTAFSEFNRYIFNNDTTKIDCPAFETLKTVTLNIKSNSGLFGYELGSEIARSLFNYLEIRPCITVLGKKIINVHINALKVVFHKDIKSDGGITGRQLLKELTDLITQDTP